jgi:hypothetical protein
MGTETRLPGVDAAREVLGLSLEEIARSVRVDYSTLYRARGGRSPNAGFLDRLEQLEELAGEIRHALSQDLVAEWLETPASVFGGRTPREMVLAGRVETVLGALLSYQHLFGSLAGVEKRKPFFLSEDPGTGRLPMATVAALAMLDADIDAMVARMQNPEARKARHEALRTRPRVRLDAGPADPAS